MFQTVLSPVIAFYTKDVKLYVTMVKKNVLKEDSNEISQWNNVSRCEMRWTPDRYAYSTNSFTFLNNFCFISPCKTLCFQKGSMCQMIDH